jgi:tight adherence protein B
VSGPVVTGVLVLAAVLLAWSEPAARLRRSADTAPAPGAAAPLRARARVPPAVARRLPGARQRQAAEAAGVATAAGELAVLLRAGLPPGAAWAHVPAERGTAMAGARDAAVRAASRGEDVAGALLAAAATAGGGAARAALRGLAATWSVTARTGAPAADVLERFAAALRADLDVSAARDTALAAPRATARVLTALPVGGLALGAALGAEPVAVLTGTAVGRVAGVVGTVCVLAGWWWTRQLLRAAQRS